MKKLMIGLALFLVGCTGTKPDNKEIRQYLVGPDTITVQVPKYSLATYEACNLRHKKKVLFKNNYSLVPSKIKLLEDTSWVEVKGLIIDSDKFLIKIK